MNYDEYQEIQKCELREIDILFNGESYMNLIQEYPYHGIPVIFNLIKTDGTIAQEEPIMGGRYKEAFPKQYVESIYVYHGSGRFTSMEGVPVELLESVLLAEMP